MGRRLYYIDWYGKVQQDRKAGKGQPASAGWTAKALMILIALALVIVVVSSIH